MRLLILHNPTAGGGNQAEQDLSEIFESAGFNIRYRSTEHGVDAADVEGHDLVAVAGGDGTVGKVLRALEGATARFTIIPLGTANNIASFLGIGGAPEDIASGLAGGRDRALDLGVAQGPWGRRVFVEGVAAGAIAGVLAEGKSKDLSGKEKIAFGREALPKGLRDAPVLRLRATVDGAALPEDLLALEVLNTSVLGPRLRLAPQAEPGDGVLHVAFLRQGRRQAFVDWLENDPDHLPSPLEVVQGRQVDFVWADEPLRLDDDYPDPPGREEVVTITLARNPLRIRVPEPLDARAAI